MFLPLHDPWWIKGELGFFNSSRLVSEKYAIEFHYTLVDLPCTLVDLQITFGMINANFHTKQVPSTVNKIQQDTFIKNKLFLFNDHHNQCLVYIQNKSFLPLTHKIQQNTLL